MLALRGLMWWKKLRLLEETDDLGCVTAILPHAGDQNLVTEVASEAIQALFYLSRPYSTCPGSSSLV